MKYSEARQGRVFVIRLEDGEIVHEKLELFAVKNHINAASLIVIGAADKGSLVVTGPEISRTKPIIPIVNEMEDANDIFGTGTIFPDDEGKPKLHLHLAGGRGDKSTVGCGQKGIIVWHVLEVVLYELVNCTARRLFDDVTGFKLLNP
jgi:predicted DNA-binding protein with PD1-like motif